MQMHIIEGAALPLRNQAMHGARKVRHSLTHIVQGSLRRVAGFIKDAGGRHRRRPIV